VASECPSISAAARSAEAGIELLKLASTDLVQKWRMSKRESSSHADDDDPTLIEKVELESLNEGQIQKIANL
jgi:hypothetical protein